MKNKSSEIPREIQDRLVALFAAFEHDQDVEHDAVVEFAMAIIAIWDEYVAMPDVVAK